jgi:hypothetical protein
MEDNCAVVRTDDNRRDTVTLAQAKPGEGVNINEYQSRIHHETDDAITNPIPVVTESAPID